VRLATNHRVAGKLVSGVKTVKLLMSSLYPEEMRGKP